MLVNYGCHALVKKTVVGGLLPPPRRCAATKHYGTNATSPGGTASVPNLRCTPDAVYLKWWYGRMVSMPGAVADAAAHTWNAERAAPRCLVVAVETRTARADTLPLWRWWAAHAWGKEKKTRGVSWRLCRNDGGTVFLRCHQATSFPIPNLPALLRPYVWENAHYLRGGDGGAGVAIIRLHRLPSCLTMLGLSSTCLVCALCQWSWM